MPISAVISNFFAFAIQFLTFLAVYGIYKCGSATAEEFGLRWQVVALPLVILHIALLSLGVGFWLSALTAKYRDFHHLSGFLVQIWMYATPVIYPLSSIPQGWRWLAIANPMTMPVECMKFLLLGTGAVNSTELAISVACTGVTLLSGLLVFQKVERTFIDTV